MKSYFLSFSELFGLLVVCRINCTLMRPTGKAQLENGVCEDAREDSGGSAQRLTVAACCGNGGKIFAASVSRLFVHTERARQHVVQGTFSEGKCNEDAVDYYEQPYKRTTHIQETFLLGLTKFHK